MSLENGDLNILGTAKKVIIKKDDTIIINGGGNKEEIQKRVENIREEMEMTTSEYDKEKL